MRRSLHISGLDMHVHRIVSGTVSTQRLYGMQVGEACGTDVHVHSPTPYNWLLCVSIGLATECKKVHGRWPASLHVFRMLSHVHACAVDELFKEIVKQRQRTNLLVVLPACLACRLPEGSRIIFRPELFLRYESNSLFCHDLDRAVRLASPGLLRSEQNLCGCT